MAKKPTEGAFKAKALLIDMKPTAYNTRFRKSALYQVKDTINSKGLPLLLVHDSSKLPVGAWYEADVDEANEALFTKFYVPKEITEYDDIKTRVAADILDSVSIGFRAGTHDCSICGNDIQDYESCSHIPGRRYDIKDPTSGATLGEETCYVMLDDVKASEASLVYNGAVPEAKIVESSDKAEFFVKNKINFTEGNLEIVHNGEILQDNYINNKIEGDNVDDLEKMQTKYQELQDKFNNGREEIILVKEKNLEYKTKVDAYDVLIEEKDAAVLEASVAKSAYGDIVASLGKKVEALAAPFDAEYKAPEDIEQLYVDLNKYLEQAKALPSGQQSLDEGEAVYSEPDDIYKV